MRAQVNGSENIINTAFFVSQFLGVGTPDLVHPDCVLFWSQGRRSEEGTELLMSGLSDPAIYTCTHFLGRLS